MPKYLDMHGLETLTGEIENTYLKKNQRGAAGGVASLNSSGKVPSSQLPDTGTSDYSDLTNKPQINGTTLSGNKTSANLGIHDIPSGGTTGQVLAKSSDSNYAVQWVNQQGGGGGTTDYTDLDNKPQINGTTLTGNKTTANLGIHDIPSGGTTGQVLAKSSNSNYAVQWVNQQGGGGGTTDYADLDNKPQINGTTLSGNKTTANLGIHDVPAGGTAGQVLAKASGTDHDVEWATPADPTSVIDDNAGPFTTDKTFSSSKLWSDLGGKVDKTGAQFDDISMGRVPNSTVGNQSIAIGTSDNPNQGAIASGDNSVAVGTYVQATGNRAIAIGSITQATGVNATAIGGSVTASGDYSFAHGSSTSAQGMNSTAEGYGTTASGISSHAEGSQTFAVGDYSHSQGYSTRAEGYASSVEGNGTVAKGANSSVSGMYNVPDSYANWPDWAPNTYYAAGAKVHFQDEESGETRGEYFVCNTSHTSDTAWITYSFYWDSDNGKMNYAQIVGNGSNYLQQSNAYTLDWDGNGSYAGDVTINKGTAEEVSVSELKTEITQAEVNSFSKYNILPYERIKAGTIKNVVITRDDDLLTFNGTANGTDSIESEELDLIPGEKYTAKVYTSSNKNINASVRYKTNGVETNLGSFGTTSNNRTLTFTCPETYDRIYIKVGVNNGITYSNDEFKISISLGESNPVYVKYGEGTSSFDGYARKELIGINDRLNKITKFVTPEMFGAIGNGDGDDATALNQCLAYAIDKSIPVLGFGKYRVRQKITINCNYMYIFLNQLISYNDTGTLLVVKGSYNKIIINRLRAEAGTMEGIVLESTASIHTLSNFIQIEHLTAYGTAIKLQGDDSEGTPTYISYNTLMLNYVKSLYANAIVHAGYASENQFYNPRIECPNGWAFYTPTAARVFGASMENNVLNGIYIEGAGYGDSGGNTFFGCRHIEMTDKLVSRLNGNRPNAQGGTLIKVVGMTTGQNIYDTDCYIPYQAIDTSEATDYTDPVADVDPPHEWTPTWIRSNASTRIMQIRGRIKYGMFDSENGGFPLGDGMIITCGKKICNPVMDSAYSITEADFDMRDNYLSQSNNHPYATRFVIDVADCVIHLASSYCCMGYNKLVIDQSTPGKLCTVYNSYDDQHPIFDGETAGEGVYELTCMCDLSKSAEQIPDVQNIYTGRNDLWTVTKLS